MSARLLRVLTIIIISALSVPLTGCGSSGVSSNYRALEQLETVGTLGIDRQLGGVLLTAAVDRGDGENGPAVLRRSSTDLRQGLETLQDYAEDRQLFFAHVQQLVLGEDYVLDGIGPVLDFAERDLNTRMGTALFVLRSEQASALLTDCGDASALLSTITRDTELDGSSHVSDLRTVAVALSEYGAAAVCALRAEATAGSVYPESSSRTAVPDGYAILKNGVLAGYLDGEDAEALGFLAGYPGTVTRLVHDGSGAAVTLELRCSGAPEFRFEKTETGYAASVELELDAVIAAVDSLRPDAPMPDTEALAAAVSAGVRESVHQVLARSAALDADFLGLGAVVRRQLGPAAQRDFLQKTEFRVQVETVPDHSYDLAAPLGMAGGAA